MTGYGEMILYGRACLKVSRCNNLKLYTQRFSNDNHGNHLTLQELKLIGEYGLRNKREVWRVKFALAKIRKAAHDLLTLEEKDPRRLFEGNALLRRLVRIGVLDETRMKLDYVLGLKIEDFLERRLQTQVSARPRISLNAKELHKRRNNLRINISLILIRLYLLSQVFKLGLAKSIHHARVLIRQRHIRVRKQV